MSALAGLVAFRLLGLHVAAGRRFDVSAVEAGIAEGVRPKVRLATNALLDTISVASLALVGGGIAALALVARGARTAFACLLLLVGANVTTQILKHGLAARHGVNVSYGFAHSFPSGHATVALSLGLALVVAAPPDLRVPAAVAAAAYATAVGAALVILGSHMPSDVAGGFCVATAWAASASLLADDFAPEARFRWELLLPLLLGAAIAAAVAVALRPGLVLHVRLHARVVEALLGIVVLAAASSLALAYAIATRSTDATRS